MMNPLRIVVPLEPEGKRRHRTRVVIPPSYKHEDPWVQEYPDPEQKQHIIKFRRHLRKGWPLPVSEKPFRFGLIAFFPIPKSKPLWWKELARKGKIQPQTKPDVSNIVKLVEDIANGIIWKDDSQIVSYLQTGKFYSDHPKYVLTVQELPSDEEVRNHGVQQLHLAGLDQQKTKAA